MASQSNPDGSAPPPNNNPNNTPNTPNTPNKGGNSWDAKGPWTPKDRNDLIAFAAAHGWSEDFQRFDERTVRDWIARYWDANARMFRTQKTARDGSKIEGFVEKPPDTPDGWTAWGAHDQAVRSDDPILGGKGKPGGGGPGGGPGGGQPGGFGGGWVIGPDGYPIFQPPTFEQAQNDPGYKFALDQGIQALDASAASKGVLRTGGQMKDLVNFGQGLASQRYQDVFGRNLQGFGANFQGWQTAYNADLQKYINRENNIYGLMNTPPPTPPQ